MSPNPYKFTVSVEHRQPHGRWRTTINEDGRPILVMSGHATEAEAREHAAQVLAALHQATMEETP